MDPNRRAWNDRHKRLRHALERTGDRKAASELFLAQHSAVHSTRLSRPHVHSFGDEILNDLSLKAWRFIPQNGNHSIAWIIWHLARVEDVTMNLLVADSDQILFSGDWLDRLQIRDVHTGNGMTDHEVVSLTDEINIRALEGYRLSVGRQTRKIVKKLKVPDYKLRVDPARVQRIWDERAMLSKAKGIVHYWANRTIAGLLLMPPTRHGFLHLNEARQIKSKAATQAGG
jgi:hypothetical protein